MANKYHKRIIIDTVSCAICGREKELANHWFLVTLLPRPDYYRVSNLPVIEGPDTLTDNDYPVCGEEHLHALAGRIIDGKIGAEESAPLAPLAAPALLLLPKKETVITDSYYGPISPTKPPMERWP